MWPQVEMAELTLGGEDAPSCEFMVLKECTLLAQPVCNSVDAPRDSQLTNQRFPICDLVGNVAEWVEDNCSELSRCFPNRYTLCHSRDRRLRFYRVLRGGAWFSNPFNTESQIAMLVFI